MHAIRKTIFACFFMVSQIAFVTATAQSTDNSKQAARDEWKEPSTVFKGQTKLQEWQTCNSPFIRPWELDKRCPNYTPNRPPPPKRIVTCDREGNSVTCTEY